MSHRVTQYYPRHLTRIAAIITLILGSGLVGCAPEPAMPTLAVLPSALPPTVLTGIAAAYVTPPTPTATATITPRPPTNTPAPPTPTPTAAPDSAFDSVEVDSMFATFVNRRITFWIYLKPMKATVRGLTLVYTYPKTGETQQWQAGSVPPNRVGEPMSPVQFSMSVDNLPPGEVEIDYRWEVTDQTGGRFTTDAQTFKLTEAITADRRDDLPVIAAKQTFASEFPRRGVFRLSMNPEVPIQNARFYYTQNQGILLRDFNVRVPTLRQGEPLELEFIYTDQFGLQIPWQQFESWWVLMDRNGRWWRTESLFSEYADKRFHTWKRTETRHAVLFTYERPAADVAELAKATDHSIERLAVAYGYRLLYRPHVVVYNNQTDFQSWAPPQLTHRFIGMASGEWGGCVVAFYDSIRFTGYSIIQHEIAHLYQFQSIRQDPPRWFIEGSATYFEEALPENVEDIVRRIVTRYGPPSLQFRVPSQPPDGSGWPWPYFVGQTVMTYLKQTYGEDIFARIHAAMARDIRFDAALRMATGDTYAEIDKGWGAWITGNRLK